PSTGARYIDYCPTGWSYYKFSCFKYFSQPQTWDEAERQCQASHAGAHLAWVEERREATTLRKVISYYQRAQPVWLGLRYGPKVRWGAVGGGGGQQGHASDPPLPAQSQTWQWASGDKYSIASGLSGNGANGGTCGVLTHLSGFTVWSSTDCTQRHHYICKFTP
ncbi:REG4 protein, partial [Himantopus himantopus]|nr:REG4 protein [Himantopus himantopus]